MPEPGQNAPQQTSYRQQAERSLTDAPNAGSMDHGRVEALVGIGWALLDLADRLAPPRPTEDDL